LTQPVVRIGLVVPLSGRDAPVGENILAAARYAIAEANEESAGRGPRFVLAAEDEATLTGSLVPQARKLAADPQNIGVVGYLSQGAIAAPVFAAADLPFLVLGSGPLPPPAPGDGAPRLRLAPSGVAFVEATTRLVTERLLAKRVATALLVASPDSGNLLSRIAESLRAAGLVVEPPVAGPAALVLAPPPDVVLVAGPGVAAAEAVLELRARGYAGPLVCVDGCDTPDFLKVAGDQAAGTMYLAAAPAPRDHTLDSRLPSDATATPHADAGATAIPDGGEPADPAHRLLKASTEAWPLAALAYDGIHLLASAARQSGTAPTRQAVSRALLSSPTPVPGATGLLSWDEAGQRRGLWPAIYEYAELRYPARLIRWASGTPGP
ncbi:MAG: ABC transporter substrate-binding protein, partial [Chloroflexi bacterium]|nr:ABC transporter substrate-binding protein [Chloroflexota bacterium]